MIHIYYGFGKGKTTCAIGAGMRAKGAGFKVGLVRFLKDNKSSELSVLPFDIFASPESLPFNPGDEYSPWVQNACDFIENWDGDMIILDEFLDIIGDFITPQKASALVKTLDEHGCEVVITGHKEVYSLFVNADYVTYMDKIKHPYDKGVKARSGIEY